MNLEHFKTYTTDDFILDDNFRKIVQIGANDQIEQLLESLPEKKQEIKLAIQILRGMQAGQFRQDKHQKLEFWQQILHKQKKEIRLLYFRYAAAILLLVGIGSSILYLSSQQPVNPVIVETEISSQDAVLILADGKAVTISSKQSTVQYSADGSGIIVNDSSDVAQSVSDKGMNQLIVPYGKHSFITLSEGTKIWLNSGSKLIFPPAFRGKTREVILVGEALFDVAKDQSKPFYVKTDAFSLKVYGTKFDVRAYEQDKDYHIVLVEGKVSMNANEHLKGEEVFLAPNQKATLSKGEANFEITPVENMENYIAWVDGYLTFTNEQVVDLLVRVSRYYNVEIVVESPENLETIYGKLDLKDDLERVLDGIAFISKTKYTREGDKYIFKSNE